MRQKLLKVSNIARKEVKKMKKMLLIIPIMLGAILIASQGSTMPIYVDLAGAGLPVQGLNGLGPPFGDANAQTGLFNEIAFYAESTVTQFDSNGNGFVDPGDSFIDNGALYATSLIPVAGTDQEGLNLVWEFTIPMENLTGIVTNVTFDPITNDWRIDYTYTGGTVDVYVDGDSNGAFPLWDYGVQADHNTRLLGDDAGFNDGLQVGSFSLQYGIGHTFLDFAGGDIDNQGSGEFLFVANWLDQGFWFTQNGIDMSTIPLNWVLATSDYNVDKPILFNSGQQNELFSSAVTHDGTIEMEIVPEPSTILLLGTGLLGIGIYARRRMKK